MRPPAHWTVLGIVALLVIYYLTAIIGLAFSIPPGNATAVWPPSGIALAALLLFGFRFWPGVWIGAFLLNNATSVSAATAASFATGNTLEVLAAAWTCRKFLDLQHPFRQVNDGFVFFSIAVGSAAIAATCGTASLFLGGYVPTSDIYANWSTWWLGDLSGIMLLTPLLLVLTPPKQWNFRTKTAVNATLSLGVLFLISQAIFGGWISENTGEGLLYVPLIIVVWLLLRFPPIVVFLGNLIIAIVAILATSRSVGPFATETVTQSLFDLQLFLTVCALAGLALTAILAGGRETERQRLELAANLEAAEQMRIKEDQLAHVARLSLMGEMVAGIAHEINQPLYAISNFAAASENLLSRSQENQHLRELNHQISDQAVRAGDIIRRLRHFVRKSDGNRTVFAIHVAIEDAIELLASDIQRGGVKVQFLKHDTELFVLADQIQIEQIIINVLRNALDSFAEVDVPDPIVTIDAWRTQDQVFTCVKDRGAGLSTENIGKVFDPFFTTKPGGMGMGTAISRTLVEAHDGRIWLSPRSGGGTAITFTLPLHQGT